MVAAALFDFGGVILTSPFEAFARYEEERGLPSGFIRSINARNPHSNAWARLERSEIDLDGFCRLFEAEARAAGAEVRATDVLQLLGGEIRPEMMLAVRRCRRRMKTGLLTNNFLTEPASGTPTHDMEKIRDEFDAVIESSKIGVRKPDPRFYELACAKLEIAPSEAVFLDDLGINLRSARELGMVTIKVDDPADAIEELERIVGFTLR